ncbi:MAG: tetratricopeptide repeat protein [Bryobacteraceae bacterium]
MVYPTLLLCVLLAAGIASRASAQPIPLQGTPADLQQAVSVSTYAGAVPATVAPVEVSSQVLVVVLADTIAPDTKDRVRLDIQALFQAGQLKDMRLAALRGGEFAVEDPFRTRMQLQSALRRILAPPAAEPVPYPPAKFYQWLSQSAGQFGSGWSTVVLVGAAPDVDAASRDYATVYIASHFQAQKVRLSYWNPAGANPGWFGEVCRATGGTLLADGLTAPATPEAGSESPAWREVTWQAPTEVRGFLLYRAKLTPASGTAVEFPAVAAHAGLELPDLDAYAVLQQNVETARQIVSVGKPTEQQAAQMRDALAQALHTNPSDPDALRLGADFYARFNDHATAAQLLTILAEANPKDAALLAELGHAHFVAKQFPQAEAVLLRARENGADGARVPEELARIHLSRGDDAGALPFLDESLKKDAKQAPLWFVRADAAMRLKDWKTQAESLERALALDNQLDRRTALVRLYLDHKENEQALRHIRVVTAALPNDAKVGQTYAEFLDELNRPDDSLVLWRKVIELDVTVEAAHFRVTRLLTDKGALPDALRAADAGLQAAPKSARLYVLKSEILEKQGTVYAARHVLRESASLDDSALLRRLSELEDISGKDAARWYLRLAEALAKQSPSSPDYLRALDRCQETALRDNDAESAQKCAGLLAAAGGKIMALAAAKRADPAQDTMVPGGLEALAFIAHSKPKTAPERFFVEYSKAVRLNKQQNDKAATAYFDTIRDHFQLVSELEALGDREHDNVRITVSLRDKKAQRQTEKILSLLGWKLRVSKNQVTLDAGEKLAQAKRQETTSALAIDEAGMQEALQARKDFTIELQDDYAPVLFGVMTWKKAFYPKDDPPGGFAGALARDARMAKLYVGLSAMDKDAADALLAGTDLKTLADKYADLEYLFSSALALHQSHAAVPGGPAAEPIWQKMAGASPSQPGAFFKALLDKDGGKLLSFYATLAQLDLQHQQFFTRNASRTAKFYELYRQAPEIARGAGKEVLLTSFFDVLREVPLDADGSVVFPGSPEVWLVAKGQVNSVARTNKLLKKVSKVAAPDEEDEILLRLARTRYKATESELDNFLAVVRIDAHRSDPLDEASALLLANHYPRSHAVYPYFSSLTGLAYEDLASFFTMAEKLESLPVLEMNTVWGEFHALARLLCLDEESGRLPAKKAAELFRQICDRFGGATGQADFAAASLDVMRHMLHEAGAGSAPPDDAVRAMLFGPAATAAFQIDGTSFETDWVTHRDKDYRHVYELQKVTPLSALDAIQDAVANLIDGKGNPSEAVKTIESATALLPVVEAPKTLKTKGKRRDNLAAYQPKKVAELVVKLGKATAKRKADKKEIERLCRDLLAEINPPVKWALTGIVYAYYFRPDDLLISEDPLFLRKHEFVDLEPIGHPDLFGKPPELQVSSEDEGSYLSGGFAGFSAAVGRVAGKGAPGGNSEAVLASQIGSLRNTDWRAISERDMLLFGLKIRLAREWIARAAENPELLNALSDTTLGTLSLSRRADLLNGLRARDWKTIWQAVTLSDLYFLAGDYLARFKTDVWESEVTRAIRKLPDTDAPGLERLGGSHPHLNGCDHSHLLRLAPYEQYERVMLPMMMAERVTELKLYLIDYAGQAGIPAEALAMVAEPLALELLRKLRMADPKDWRPVPLAFSSLDEERLLSALKNL